MSLTDEQSDSGDKCHRNIRNVGKSASQKYAREHIKSPNIYICCNGDERQLTKGEHEDLKNLQC